MPDQRITELDPATVVRANYLFVVVDPLDQSMAVTGTDLKATKLTVQNGMFEREHEAGADISALQPVAIVDGLAYPASSSNAAHRGKVVGIATSGATLGQTVRVACEGAVVEDAFLGFDGNVYVGVGVLQATAPASGFSQIIGAGDETSVAIHIGPAIRRA